MAGALLKKTDAIGNPMAYSANKHLPHETHGHTHRAEQGHIRS